MNRAKTRSMIVRSQVAAVVLLVAGGVLAFAPSPFGSGVPKVTSKPAPTGASEVKAHIVPIDVTLASSLVRIALEQPAEKPLPPPVATNLEPEKEKEKAKTVWEYIGGLIGPTSRRAVVTIAGDQKVVSEGDTVDGSKVNAITSDFIMVEAEGKEERIDRKNRKERVAIVPPASTPASGMAAMVKNQAAAAKAAAMNTGNTVAATPNGRNKRDKGSPEYRDKQRRLYMEAVRANNNSIPDPDTLAKYGVTDFEPTAEELDQIGRSLKDPEGGGKSEN